MRPLSALETVIVEQLAKAHGRANAVTAARLGDLLELPSRRVREIISDGLAAISQALPMPLVSIPPHGYWLTTEADDLLERHKWLVANRDRYDAQIAEHAAMCKRHGLGSVLVEDEKPKKQRRPVDLTGRCLAAEISADVRRKRR